MELEYEIKRLNKFIDIKNKEFNDEKKRRQQLQEDLNILKSSINFDIEEGEQLMTVIFQSNYDYPIHHSLFCTKKEKFKQIVERLYTKFPELKSFNHYFNGNAKILDLELTLEENGIKDGAVIMILKEES